MNKNPFSIFDFFGYVFPGAFVLLAVVYFVKMGQLDFVNPMTFNEVITVVRGWLNVPESVVYCSVFMLLSYMVGHIVAYISSITIERFVIWWYGYPSEFLILDEGKHWHFLHEWISMARNKEYHYRIKIARTYILRVIISLLLFPILLPTLFLKVTGADVFLVKRLDEYLRDAILSKRKALCTYLSLPNPAHYDKVDYHRVIYHYAYEHSTSHRQKMDNYVALYDFLRSMTLIFVGIFMYIMIYGFIVGSTKGIYFWLSLIALLAISYLFYMSFFKFYRRFTLEAFMCLVSDSELK